MTLTEKEKTVYITRPNDGSAIFQRITLLLVSQETLKVHAIIIKCDVHGTNTELALVPSIVF